MVELKKILTDKRIFDFLTPFEKLESPIEERWINHVMKYLKKGTEVISQYPVSTISGNFRIDFVLKNGDYLIGIECDGQEHHSDPKDTFYDEWRDVLILMSSDVKTIYRIKGTDIYNNIADTIFYISQFEDKIFSRRVLTLKDIVLPELLENDSLLEDIRGKMFFYYDKDGNSDKIQRRMQIIRRRPEEFTRFELRYIMYSYVYPSEKITKLIERHDNNLFNHGKVESEFLKKYPKFKIK